MLILRKLENGRSKLMVSGADSISLHSPYNGLIAQSNFKEGGGYLRLLEHCKRGVKSLKNHFAICLFNIIPSWSLFPCTNLVHSQASAVFLKCKLQLLNKVRITRDCRHPGWKQNTAFMMLLIKTYERATERQEFMLNTKFSLEADVHIWAHIGLHFFCWSQKLLIIQQLLVLNVCFKGKISS